MVDSDLILFSNICSILGAMLIVLGLYMTLWGKESERKKKHTERGRYGQTIEIKLENCNEL